jgi:hypothetical protein
MISGDNRLVLKIENYTVAFVQGKSAHQMDNCRLIKVITRVKSSRQRKPLELLGPHKMIFKINQDELLPKIGVQSKGIHRDDTGYQ